jgi:hypothetical protein
MRQHRLAEQALEQAEHVRMQLERMAVRAAIEAPQHIEEGGLRIDAGLGRIGQRLVHRAPLPQPAGRGDRLEETRPHPHDVRARQEPLDEQVALGFQTPGERRAVVQQARGIEERIHRVVSQCQSLSRPPVTLSLAAVM